MIFPPAAGNWSPVGQEGRGQPGALGRGRPTRAGGVSGQSCLSLMTSCALTRLQPRCEGWYPRPPSSSARGLPQHSICSSFGQHDVLRFFWLLCLPWGQRHYKKDGGCRRQEQTHGFVNTAKKF